MTLRAFKNTIVYVENKFLQSRTLFRSTKTRLYAEIEAPTGASFFINRGKNMAFRVVLIENEVAIKVKLNNLVITKNDKDIWIPLDDISMIVMDNLSTVITTRLLCQLSEAGIGLMLCNQQHLPTGYYSSYDNHSRSSKVIGYQVDKSRDYYDSLWRQVVIAKIVNQAKAYVMLKGDETGGQKIFEFAENITEGDKTNREAHAAKVYFNLLMGTSFSRGNEDILLNSGLDYGYAVLRGYIARVCVGYGLNTQLGIHHKSEYNRFNLVDDLMEPFRPLVDMVAYEMMGEAEYFMPEHRRRLVGLLNMKMLYRNKKMYLCNVLENYIEQYASLIMGRGNDIVFPDVDNFLGEEIDGL